MIRILIVDDSTTVRQLLAYEFSRQEDMTVIGEASDGLEAVRKAVRLKPDVITMDFKMPGLNGLEATREIIATQACPIIVVSEYLDQDNRQNIFDALDAGAVAVANKPLGPGHPDYERTMSRLLRTMRTMSEIKVVTRRHKRPRPDASTVAVRHEAGIICPPACRPNCAVDRRTCRRVVIGASTGGPVVLRQIFERIPRPYPLPILVVQHISPGFLSGLVDWLQNVTGHRVQIAKQGELPQSGCIYFAPDDRHMELDKGGRIQLRNSPKEYSLRPAVSRLFQSAAEHVGRDTVGILLTGMGTDGAIELKQLKEAGAPTVIQSEESCVVFGMPGEAFKLDAARHVLSPEEIAQFLTFAVSARPEKE